MQNRTSRTAEHVALFRAIETARKNGVIHDPFAAAFLHGRYGLLAQLARIPAVRVQLERYLDRRFPGGPRASAVVRTRLIDDLAEESGATQVVLLGAGYDSRAYRLPGMRSARVFEVDHPATQTTKRKVVEARVGAGRRGHVRFVGVDLMVDALRPALLRAGFSPGERTVVIWEGVTNYLTADAVDTTLRDLAGILATGSRIVFTYVDRRALDGSGTFTDVWEQAPREHGEPWTFGLVPAEMKEYLAERGFDLKQDLSTRDAADRFLPPERQHEPAAAFYRIVEAEGR